jgi:hypothetical protein
MSTLKGWLPAALILSALAACASAAPTRTATASAPRAYVTGSRIAVPVDSRTGSPGANPALQQVTSDQIALTGQTDPGLALRRLVPDLH